MGSGIDAEWYSTPDIPDSTETAITALVGQEVFEELKEVVSTFLDASHFEKQEPNPSEVRDSIEEIATLSANLIEKLRGISQTVDVELQEALFLNQNLVWPEFRKTLLDNLQKLETSAHHASRLYETRRSNFEVAERITSKGSKKKLVANVIDKAHPTSKGKTKPQKLAQKGMAFEVAVCMKSNGLPVTTSQSGGRADTKSSDGSKYVEVVALILSLDEPGDRTGAAHNLARAILKLKRLDETVAERKSRNPSRK